MFARARIFGLLCILVPMFSQGDSNAAGTAQTPGGSAARLDHTERKQFAGRQTAALEQSAWGRDIVRLERLADCVPPACSLSADERRELLRAHQPELAVRAGLGKREWPDGFLLYLPDRLFDLFDIVSLAPTVGLWVPLEVHLSRYFGFGFAFDFGATPAFNYNRNLSLIGQGSMMCALGPLLYHYRQMQGMGTAWTRGRPGEGDRDYAFSGLYDHHQDELSQDGWVDPFGIGVGWSVELHPLEFFDFIAGLLSFGYCDFLRDDFANVERAPYKIGFPVDEVAEEDFGAEEFFPPRPPYPRRERRRPAESRAARRHSDHPAPAPEAATESPEQPTDEPRREEF